MRCLWTQSAQDINGFPPNFHPPDSSSTGIHKDSMGFKWFHQQSIGVICGKPKIFIEVGDELWHWFYIVLICFITLLELKGKPTSKTHFWVIDTLQTKPNFRGELSNSKVKAHRKARKNRARGVSQTLDRQNPMGVIPQGLYKNVVLTVSTQVKLRCYITNKI